MIEYSVITMPIKYLKPSCVFNIQFTIVCCGKPNINWCRWGGDEL